MHAQCMHAYVYLPGLGFWSMQTRSQAFLCHARRKVETPAGLGFLIFCFRCLGGKGWFGFLVWVHKRAVGLTRERHLEIIENSWWNFPPFTLLAVTMWYGWADFLPETTSGMLFVISNASLTPRRACRLSKACFIKLNYIYKWTRGQAQLEMWKFPCAGCEPQGPWHSCNQ